MSEGTLKTKIALKEIIKETSEVYSFVFEIPEGLAWIAGQHGIFRYHDRVIEDDKGFRIFSIASIKEENILMFSTRITNASTDFKQQLLTMNPGETMTVEGINGKFKIEDYTKKACIMAGGIGITPVRAVIKQLVSTGEKAAGIKVLYSDDRGEFAYEKTLKAADEMVSGLSIDFISDRVSFVEMIDSYVEENGNDSTYLISGTPGMNTFITERLVAGGIDKNNIVTDTFMGYE